MSMLASQVQGQSVGLSKQQSLFDVQSDVPKDSARAYQEIQQELKTNANYSNQL